MNNEWLEDQVAELIDILTILILDHPHGLSEYELLTLLQQPPYEFFAKGAMSDPLQLFQTHFLLFHCLYRIRGQWLNNNQALLTVSALKIVRTPLPEQSSYLLENQAINQVLNDPLTQYYLDLSHLNNTDRSDVEALLDSFWNSMNNASPRFASTESLAEAMKILELKAPIEVKDLKGQYRRLAQRYHPDKGGDGEYFKKICRAYHQLKHCDLSTL